MTKVKTNEINLTILNKLVSELQEQVKLIQELPQETPKENRVVELSKALGFSSAISYESSGLVADIATLIKESSLPETNLVDILGGLGNKSAAKN